MKKLSLLLVAFIMPSVCSLAADPDCYLVNESMGWGASRPECKFTKSDDSTPLVKIYTLTYEGTFPSEPFSIRWGNKFVNLNPSEPRTTVPVNDTKDPFVVSLLPNCDNPLQLDNITTNPTFTFTETNDRYDSTNHYSYTLTVTGTTEMGTGIYSINAEPDAMSEGLKPVYFTPDGLRVDPDSLNPGMYIEICGSASRKILVR